jgi:hypothetical protein
MHMPTWEPNCTNSACNLSFRIAGVFSAGEDTSRRATQKLCTHLENSPLRRRVRLPSPNPPPSVGAGSPAAGSSSAPSVVRNKAQFMELSVEVADLFEDLAAFKAAKAELSWEHIREWANSKSRTVVQKRDLKRMWDFTTKVLLVRRPNGQLAGCALICEAPENCLVCDSLRPHTNPSLPLVKTERMNDFGPIKEAHVRSAFVRATSDHPIDELVLICGERGSGSAVMAHLKGRQRIMFASVVPGSCEAYAATRRFYDKYFRPCSSFIRADGEQPYAAWLGAD